MRFRRRRDPMQFGGTAPDGRPLFIPKDKIEKGVVYQGYEAGSDGLHHYSVSPTPGSLVAGDLTERQVHYQIPDWGVEPLQRRTPQERAVSLAQRVFYQYEKYGLPPEVLATMVHDASWKAGDPLSFEQATEIARVYLERAEREAAEKAFRPGSVTRTSPYVLSPGPLPRPAAGLHPVITGAESPSSGEKGR